MHSYDVVCCMLPLENSTLIVSIRNMLMLIRASCIFLRINSISFECEYAQVRNVVAGNELAHISYGIRPSKCSVLNDFKVPIH